MVAAPAALVGTPTSKQPGPTALRLVPPPAVSGAARSTAAPAGPVATPRTMVATATTVRPPVTSRGTPPVVTAGSATTGTPAATAAGRPSSARTPRTSPPITPLPVAPPSAATVAT